MLPFSNSDIAIWDDPITSSAFGISPSFAAVPKISAFFNLEKTSAAFFPKVTTWTFLPYFSLSAILANAFLKRFEFKPPQSPLSVPTMI